MLIDRFHPIIGGSEIQAQRISEQLIKKGIKVLVVTRRIQPEMKRFEYIGEIPVYRFSPCGLTRYANYLTAVKIMQFLAENEEKYDIIHVHSPGNLAAVAVIISKIYKKKCIIKIGAVGVIKEVQLEGTRISLTDKVLKKLFVVSTIRRYLLKKADIFVSVSSETSKELFEYRFKKNNIRLIPNSVDVNKFHTVSQEEKMRLRKDLHLPPNKFIATFVGRLVYRKGVDTLLRALKKILHDCIAFYILIIGSGKNQIDSCEKELKDLVAKNGLERWVKFTGNVTDVEKYLQASDIFILPSRREGLCNALLEAMACGLPVIATRISGNEDVVKDKENGKLISIDDVEELAHAVLSLINDKSTMIVFGKKSRQTIVDKFSLAVVTEKYYNLYSRIMGEC